MSKRNLRSRLQARFARKVHSKHLDNILLFVNKYLIAFLLVFVLLIARKSGHLNVEFLKSQPLLSPEFVSTLRRYDVQKEVDHNVSSWNYVVEDEMRQSKKCSGDIKRNGVLQGFRDKFGERFSGILHTALLMPRTSSIVYVGMQDVKPLFENLSMVSGDRLVDCKAKIQWSFASSVNTSTLKNMFPMHFMGESHC